MTIENDHLFLVNDEEKSYKIKYEKIKEDIESDIDAFPEAPIDTKQYGRQQGAWTEIVHTPEYTDDDVDAHLNTLNASAGKVLSYSGTDYEWVEQSGEGGGGSNTYKHDSGISRSIKSRLEDYTSVKDFGAEGDGTTDDTDAIQACINWVGGTVRADGKSKQQGGTVYFPPGTYLVKQSDIDDSTSNRKMCALLVPYDNVHLVGAGQDATIIKAIDSNPSSGNEYGIIQVLKNPVQNPAVTVNGGSIRNLTLDNNVSNTDVLDGGTLSLKGVTDYIVDNVEIKNSGFYGIGMQNGGFRNVTISNVTLTNINRDGIDLKDNGNTSWGVRVDNVTCNFVGRGVNPTAPFACVDLMGDALQVSNLVCKNLGAGCGSGLRIKQGDGDRGDPGRYASISNAYIEYTGSPKIKYGIQIKARGVSVYGAKVRGEFQYGINIEQAGCTLTGCYVQGDRTDNTGTIGCYIEPRSRNDDTEYPDLGGEYTMIQGCQFRNTYKSIQVRRPNCTIMGNAFFNTAIGVDLNGSNVTNAAVIGNTFCKDANDNVKNTIYQKNEVPALILNNVNDYAVKLKFKESNTYGPMMTFEATDGAEILKIGRGIGFYGTDPKRQQTVTGDIGTNLGNVVNDLLVQLDQIGLIKKGTSGTPGQDSGGSGEFDPNGQLKTSSTGIGFYGKSPVSKRTTQGKVQGGSLTQTQNALKDLIDNLEQIGLINDGTS